MSKNNNQYVMVISVDGLAQHYLENPKLQAPNLRSLIQNGAVARGLESIYPTETWAIHSSIVTGTYPSKHGVVGNWSFDREKQEVICYAGDVHVNKEETLLQETYYDLAKKNGWTTASVCWPVTKEAKSIDYNIPEFYNQELFEKFSTTSFWNELKEAGLPVDKYAIWSLDHARGHMQDWLTAEISKYLIRKHRPNLLQLHFLLPDSYQHDFGVNAEEILWSIEYVDERIGDILSTLKQEGIYDQTNIFIMSDHGHQNYLNVFNPNSIFEEKGWISESFENSKVLHISQSGSGFIYIQEKDPVEKARLLAQVKELLEQQESVETIFVPESFSQLGVPTLEDNARLAPDLVIEAADDWKFGAHPKQIETFKGHGHTGINDTNSAQSKTIHLDNIAGTHGYLPTKDTMKAIFVASGPAIRNGVELPLIKAVDVAPTISKLIGGELQNVDGQVIEEVYKSPVLSS
ncbi:TPA: alkaline phosphatase family protein [Bacillus paranthracis]